MLKSRVLVVGTTNDYIKLLSRRFEDRLLFATDTPEIGRRTDFQLDADSEVGGDLSNHEAILSAVKSHIEGRSIKLSGITCFDCESLSLAAHLARAMNLPYPTPNAVANCRSKYASKQLWKQNDVLCPEFLLVKKVGDLIDFQQRLGGPIVVKPLTGSGSEFVSLCENRLDCMRACLHIQKGIVTHKNPRMYARDEVASPEIDPRVTYIAEEYIGGREYSCDVIIDGQRLDIVRIARKFPVPNLPLGTIMAYFLPAYLPGGLDREAFQRQLHRACTVVGLKRAMVMVDFMVQHGRAYLLELTPRPGGDCLPELIKASSGFDILGAALDFAEGRPVAIPPADRWDPLIGLRLPADSEGIIEVIDDTEIRHDPRVISCTLKREPGDSVVLPPNDYESWNLGTVIFRPASLHRIGVECRELRDKLRLEMKTPQWMGIHAL